jgi:hypothetical protein
MGLIVAEREKDRAFLATKIGQLVIQLNKSDRAHCIKLSFEVAPNSDFGELARELAKEDVRSELRNDSIPGLGQVLSFADDKGTTISCQGVEPSRQARAGCRDRSLLPGMSPLHPTSNAPSPSMRRFWPRLDWIGDFFCFMRCNPDHHP